MVNIKKSVALLLAALMLVTMLPLQVFATDEVTPSFNHNFPASGADKTAIITVELLKDGDVVTNVDPGDDVTVRVSFSTNYPTGSMIFPLVYDKRFFEDEWSGESAAEKDGMTINSVGYAADCGAAAKEAFSYKAWEYDSDDSEGALTAGWWYRLRYCQNLGDDAGNTYDYNYITDEVYNNYRHIKCKISNSVKGGVAGGVSDDNWVFELDLKVREDPETTTGTVGVLVDGISASFVTLDQSFLNEALGAETAATLDPADLFLDYEEEGLDGICWAKKTTSSSSTSMSQFAVNIITNDATVSLNTSTPTANYTFNVRQQKTDGTWEDGTPITGTGNVGETADAGAATAGFKWVSGEGADATDLAANPTMEITATDADNVMTVYLARTPASGTFNVRQQKSDGTWEDGTAIPVSGLVGEVKTAGDAGDHYKWVSGEGTDATDLAANPSMTLTSGTNTATVYKALESYAITFKTAAGTNIATSDVLYGAAITAPAYSATTSPALAEGKKVDGWKLNNEGSVLTDLGTASAAATYYAAESDITYVVKYYANTNGAWNTAPADGYVSKTYAYHAGVTCNDTAKTVDTYTIAANAGYEFKGWSTNASATAADADITALADDTNLYAVYAPVSYTITYVLDGGTVATANLENYTIETENFTLNNPTKEGYSFAGWTGTGLSEATTTVAVSKGSTGDRTYTATWEANGNTVYKVNYRYQNADGTYPDSYQTLDCTGTTGAQVNAVDKLTAGNLILTGFETPDAVNVTITADGQASANVDIPRKSYSYTFKSKTGANVASGTALYGATFTTDAVPTAAQCTKYYEFNGWDSETLVNCTVSGNTYTMGNGDAVITAAETPIAYGSLKLKYELLDGGMTEKPIANSVTVESENWFTFTPDDIKDLWSEYFDGAAENECCPVGKAFAGIKIGDNVYTYDDGEGVWMCGEEEVSSICAGDLPAGSIIAEIQYAPAVYEVYFLNNYAADSEFFSLTGDDAVAYGGQIALPGGTPAAEGLVFAYWADENGTELSFPVTLNSDNFDLEGNPTEVVIEAVFNANYTVETYVMDTTGAYDEENPDTTEKSAVIGTEVDARTGYTPGEGFKLDETKNSDDICKAEVLDDGTTVVKLYVERNKHTATYYNGDDSFEDEVYYGAEVPEPSGEDEFKKDGYTLGWTTNPENAGVGGTADPNALGSMPDKDTTFYAVWTANTDTQYKYRVITMDTAGNYDETTAFTTGTGTTGDPVDATTVATPLGEGFELDTDKSGYKATGIIAGDGSLELTVYVKRVSNLVTFYDTDNTTALGDTFTKNYYYGATITAPAQTDITDKPGYGFGGWVDEDAAAFNPTMGAAPVSYYPVWTLGTTGYKYRVIYMATDGTYDEDTPYNNDSAATNSTVNLADGLELDDWFSIDTVKTGSGAAGTLTSGSNLELTLYIKRAKANVTFYDTDNTTALEGFSGELYYGAAITVPAETDLTANAGYTFDGWKATRDGAKVDVEEYMGTSDLTYYPVWTANTDTQYKYRVITMDTAGNYDETTAFTTGTGTTGDPVDATTVATPLGEGFELDTDKSGYKATGIIAGDGSLELTVYVKRVSNLVTFYDTDNTTALGDTFTKNYYYGATITAPVKADITAKDGYRFLGWATEADAEAANFTATMGTVPVSYYSVWTEGPSSFRVLTYTQKADGTMSEVSKEYSEGVITGTSTSNYFTAPDAEEGFYYDTVNSIDDLLVDGDGSTELKLYYYRNTTYVKFVLNNGDEDVVESGLYGASVNVPTGLTKAGYSDYTWDKSVEGLTFPAATTETEPLTITANWTPNKHDVNVTIYTEKADGDGYDENTICVGSVDTAATATVQAVTLEAGSSISFVYGTETLDTIDVNEFAFNSDDSVLSATAGNDNEDVELSIYITRKTYDITYTVAGDEVNTVEDVKFGATIPAYTYTEAGYEDISEWTGMPADGKMPAQDLTLTATAKTAKDITITINPNGGTAVYNETEYTESFDVVGKYGDPVPTIGISREGYEFQGWSPEIPATFPTEDIICSAIWPGTSVADYTINIYFMGVNGQYDETSPTTTTAKANIGQVITLTPGSNDGFIFDAAKTNGKNTGTVTADGKAVLKLYYARDSINVIWHIGETEVPQTYFYGAVINAPAVDVEGASCSGWGDSATATAPVTIPAQAGTSDLEYWAILSTNTYTITYMVDGVQSGEVETYAFDADIEIRQPETKYGYTFSGWDTTLPAKMPAEDIVINGSFTINKHSVTYYDAAGEVFETYDNIEYGAEIPVPAETPTKDYYTFSNWDNIPAAMPDDDVEIRPVMTPDPIKLIAKEGSTTIIDNDTHVIYGLEDKLTEAKLLDKFLDVEGNGTIVFTPVATNWYGTGTIVNVKNNESGELVAGQTYVILLIGDVNGDGRITAPDVAAIREQAAQTHSYVAENALLKFAMDTDRTGRINGNDATCAQQQAALLLTIDQCTAINFGTYSFNG